MTVGVDVQDRADRRLELGVHQHDVLAIGERLEHHLRAELDRAGDLAHDVDVLAPAEQERIVGVGRTAASGDLIELGLGSTATGSRLA